MIYRYKDNQIPELASVLSTLLAGSIQQLDLGEPASSQKRQLRFTTILSS
jgi:hypothetical protein